MENCMIKNRWEKNDIMEWKLIGAKRGLKRYRIICLFCECRACVIKKYKILNFMSKIILLKNVILEMILE